MCSIDHALARSSRGRRSVHTVTGTFIGPHAPPHIQAASLSFQEFGNQRDEFEAEAAGRRSEEGDNFDEEAYEFELGMMDRRSGLDLVGTLVDVLATHHHDQLHDQLFESGSAQATTREGVSPHILRLCQGVDTDHWWRIEQRGIKLVVRAVNSIHTMGDVHHPFRSVNSSGGIMGC